MTSTASSLVFIDARVENRDAFLSTLPAGTEVIVLTQDENGLEQIAQALEGRSDVPAIHLVSHGWRGDIWLGNSYLSAENLSDSADLLADIGARLSDTGDILLYGCNTAAGTRGVEFVDSLAALTGADVAASDDRTGAGGDWQLEVSAGTIEAETLTADDYQQSLATLTVTNNSDSGASSLRQHISDASSGDTITFDADYNIQLSSGELVINKNLTIDGDWDDDGAADITLDANYSSRVLSITSGTVTLDGLIVREGLVSGDGGTAQGNNPGEAGKGGGIYNQGILTLTNSTLSNNLATGGGGAGVYTNGGTTGAAGGGGGSGYSGTGGGDGGANYQGNGGGTGGSGTGGGGAGYKNAGVDNYGSSGAAGGQGGADANYAAYIVGGSGGTTTAGGAGGSNWKTPGVRGGTGGDGGFVNISGGNGVGGGGGGTGYKLGTTTVGAAGGDAGGAIYNEGTLTITNSTLSNNAAAGGGGGGGGGATVANGGDGGDTGAGIFNASSGTLNYNNTVTFSSNQAAGGTGGGSVDGSTGATGSSQTEVFNDGGTVDSAYAPPNAVPTVTGAPSSDLTITEDTAAAIDLSGMSFDDTDGDPLTVTLTVGAGTIASTDGNTTTGGVTITNSGTGAISLAGTAANINTYLDTTTVIQYTPAANASGANSTTFTVSASDGNGGNLASNPSVNFDITAVNDAPTETGTFPTDITVTEDIASDLDLSGLTLADVDSTGDMTLTLTATGGTMAASDNGGVVIGGTGTNTLTLTGTVSEIDTYLNTSTAIKYTSALNENGSDAQTVAVKINDGDGSGDVALGTFNLDITAVDDAPVLSGTPTLAQSEDAAATAMDLSGVTVSDVDTSGDITLTVSVADTSAALSATATGTVNSVDVTQVNAYTITLAGTASELNTYLGSEGATNITYATSANNTSDDTLTIVANDGNSNSNSLTPTITINAVNDEPTASATGDDSSAAGAGLAVSVFSSTAISAVDTGENIASVTFTVSGLVDTGNEKLNYDGTAIDLLTDTSGAYINTASLVSYAVAVSGSTATVTFKGPSEASAANTVFQSALDGMTYENTLAGVTTGNRAFTLTEVKDAGGTSNGGDDTLTASITSTISVINGDTPTATNATKAATEDTPFSMTTSEIVLAQETNTTDALEFITLGTVSGGTLAFTGTAITSGTTSSGGSGAVTLVDATAALTAGQHIHVDNIANIQFTPTTNSTTPGSVLYTVTDAGGDTSGSATLTINLAAVEDAPTLTDVTTTITALEDTATNLVIGAPVFADVDTTADIVVTLTATDGSAALTASDAGGVVVGNSGSNAITLTGTATEINTFLSTPANVTYTGSSNNVTTDSVVISVNDGEGGTDANATTITVNFTAINDEPTVSATGTGGSSINGVATNLFNSTAIDVAVPDTGDLVTSVTFTVSGLQDGADEKINIDGTAITLTNSTSGTTTGGNTLGYAVSVTGTTATVVLTNAGIAEAAIESVLDAMTYENTSDSFSEGNRVITLTEVKDGGSTTNSGDDTWSTGGITSTVTVVDGTKPTATSYNDSVNEDTAVNLSATELPTAQDTGPTDAIEYITIDTSAITGGILSLDSAGTAGTSTVGAVAYDVAAGNLTGTVNINILDIAKLDFTPTTNLAGTGAANFSWTVTDAGGHTSPAATYTLDITNTADDPSGADKSISINTGAAHTFSASDFGFTDPDSGDTLNRIQVNVQTIDNGALELSNATVNNGDWINLVDIGNLVYTPSAAGEDTFTFTVEDNTAATSSPNTVTINTSTPPSSGGGGTPAPTPTTETIDGAVVTTTEETDDSGNVVSVISIAPVTEGRADSDATTSQADVPLHFADDAGTDVVTTVSLPTGVGIAARANDTAHSRNTLDDLINLINETAGGTESSHSDMVSGGESFLEALTSSGGDTTLWVNQVTLTSDGTTTPDTAIKVTGSASNDQSNFQEALVIDTRQLPTGSLLELDDIEFAVIVGDGVTIRGGEGKNTIFAGEGSQNIVLGADDDQLHGGDGDDTVGSRGGDDLLFGDAGNDTMFGGEGNDQLHGGLDGDIATYEGNISEYDVVQEHGIVTVSRKDDPNDTDTLINIEQIQFADQNMAPVYDSQLQSIATLYDHILGRQADLDGFQYWSGNNSTQAIGQIALDFITSDEYQQANNVLFDQLSSADQVEQLYQALLNRSSDSAGKTAWLTALDNGMTMEQVTELFVTSAELSPQYLQASSWDFTV